MPDHQHKYDAKEHDKGCGTLQQLRIVISWTQFTPLVGRLIVPTFVMPHSSCKCLHIVVLFTAAATAAAAAVTAAATAAAAAAATGCRCR